MIFSVPRYGLTRKYLKMKTFFKKKKKKTGLKKELEMFLILLM